MKILVGQQVFGFLSVYAPQCCFKDAVKDLFYDQLRVIPASASLMSIVMTSSTGSGYKEVHGGLECERILEYALAYDLLLCNIYPKKRNSHLIT